MQTINIYQPQEPKYSIVAEAKGKENYFSKEKEKSQQLISEIHEIAEKTQDYGLVQELQNF